MIDISAKPITLRTARAGGFLKLTPAALERLKAGTLPKGDPLPIARAAGLLAAKQTQHLIPHCHPIAIDHFTVDFEVREDGIAVEVFGRSIGRTGIEMEALTACSVAALTLYDLFKPVEKNMEINGIRLLEKTGGRSAMRKFVPESFGAAVLVCSDAAAAGTREDTSGAALREVLTGFGGEIVDFAVVPDEADQIRARLAGWIELGVQLIVCTGGTGAGPRDRTTEIVREICDRELDGVGEAMRAHGVARNPLAMLSRSVAGVAGQSLVLALPGSESGVRESLNAVLPGLFHALGIVQGAGH